MKCRQICLLVLSLFVLFVAVIPAAAQRGWKDELVLQGKVRSIKRLPGESDYVRFDVELDIDFVNLGTRPVIFLLPQPEARAEIFGLDVLSLALSRLQAEEGPHRWDIWYQTMLPGVDTSPQFREMVKRLDKPLPPPDVTRILQPSESWTWQTSVHLRFNSQTVTRYVNRSPSSTDLGWDVIGKIGAPLWLRLRYSVWSLNLQSADKSLRARLQRRWRNVGYLNVEPDLETQAIELDLSKVTSSDSR